MYDDDTSTEHIGLMGPMDYPLHAWLCKQTTLGPTNVAGALVESTTVGEARSILRQREGRREDVSMDEPTEDEPTEDAPTEDAPTARQDGTPLPKYRHAVTILVDSYGVDEQDSLHRALAALRVPSGPFRHSTDVVRGPGQRWMCEAEVVHAQGLMSRELGDDNPDL